MKLFIIIINILFLLSCANNPIRSYNTESNKIIQNIYQNKTQNIITGESSDILFNMEQGTFLRMLSQYSSSDQQFSYAQLTIDQWVNSWKNSTYGKITSLTTTMLINDNAIAYQTKGYEKTMLASYRALNHIDNNNWGNARIEIKKMYEAEQAIENYNQLMYLEATANAKKIQSNPTKKYIYQQIINKYDFSDLNAPAVLKLKNSYQSAFSHYLAGFVFEALGEYSLARPGYMKAGELIPTNKLIQQSIDNLDQGKLVKKNNTKLLIIEEVGHAPQIKSQSINIPLALNFTGKSNLCINMINIFFPRLIKDQFNQGVYQLSVDSNNTVPLLFTDFNLMMARYLHDQIPHLISRNITAAVRNIATSQIACEAGNGLGTVLSLATSLTGMVLDRADERTWVLLPSKIYLTEMELAYGKHQLKIKVNDIVHTQEFKVNAPYQIITLRVFGDKVYFNLEEPK